MLKIFFCVVINIFYVLVTFIGCVGKPQSNAENKVSKTEALNIIPEKQDSTFPMNSTKDSIEALFKIKGKTKKIKIISNALIERNQKLTAVTKLRIGKHRLIYEALFKEAGDEPPYGRLRSDNFISTRIIWDGTEFQVKDGMPLGVLWRDEKNDFPVILIPDGNYLTECIYNEVSLGDKTYYILDTGPVSCGLCDYSMCFIFEVPKTGGAPKFYYLIRELVYNWEFMELPFGDINGDNALDFYIECDVESKTSGRSLYLPITTAPTQFSLLEGAPYFYIDDGTETAKYFTGDPIKLLIE